jgi:hypothetical protein
MIILDCLFILVCFGAVDRCEWAEHGSSKVFKSENERIVWESTVF